MILASECRSLRGSVDLNMARMEAQEVIDDASFAGMYIEIQYQKNNR